MEKNMAALGNQFMRTFTDNFKRRRLPHLGQDGRPCDKRVKEVHRRLVVKVIKNNNKNKNCAKFTVKYPGWFA